jgi:F-type H+-transporting ATPase subunit alpha
LLDDIAVKDIKKFEVSFLNFVNEKHKDVIESIEKEKKLDDAMEEKIKALVEEYKGLFQA